jgi:hypothetical protein
MGPSRTKGATLARLRRPATKVMVFQWACGTWSINRCPRGQRPRSRTMLVEVAVSSRNTMSGWIKHALLSHPAPLCARYVRARLLRCPQTFFEADLVALKEAPCAATAGDPSLVHRRNDFIKRQVRLPSNQRRQKGRVRFQRRDAAPARLGSKAPRRPPTLHPFDC